MELSEVIDTRLRGKYQLLIAGYAWLLNRYKKRPRDFRNEIALELEIEELEASIKDLKRQFRQLTKRVWGKE